MLSIGQRIANELSVQEWQVKAAVDVWGPVRGLDLMRRVKDQFDPHRVLSPGRFVGGI